MLTASSVSYLFASDWAPGGSPSMRLPGGKADGVVTAANLLNVALWSLVAEKLVAVEPLRPAVKERLGPGGGASFTAVTVLDTGTGSAGLEGALLNAARRPRGTADELGRRLSGDHERGLRGTVLALELHSAAPWNTVGALCLEQLRDAGLVEVKGRAFPKPLIVDQAAVQALRARDAEIVAARRDYRASAPEIDDATLGDCLAAVQWAHHGSPD